MGKSVRACLCALVFGTLLLAGCGGGSSAPPSSATISGSAVKGIIQNGLVTAQELGADGTVLRDVGTALTDAAGQYSLTLGATYTGGPLKISIAGANDPTNPTMTVCDVADTIDVNGVITKKGCGAFAFSDPMPMGSLVMEALYPGNVAAGNAINVQVTPFTNAAAKAIMQPGVTVDAARITAMNQAVGDMLGGVDILNAVLVNLADPTAANGATAQDLQYAYLVAAVANLAFGDYANAAQPVTAAVEALAITMAGGAPPVSDGGSLATVSVNDIFVAAQTEASAPNAPTNAGTAATNLQADQAAVTGAGGSFVLLKDADGDGVKDFRDNCPATPTGETVDVNGCAASQMTCDDNKAGTEDSYDVTTASCVFTPIVGFCDDGNVDTVDAYVLATDSCTHTLQDADSDGVGNAVDQCSATPAGEAVDVNGCSASQMTCNDNKNGTADSYDVTTAACVFTPIVGYCDDQNPDTVDAYVLATDSCTHTLQDADGDGVGNTVDQCSATPAGEAVDVNGCAASQMTCNDNKQGTADSYDVTTASCVFTPIAGFCDDGKLGTTDGYDLATDSCTNDPTPGFCDDNDPNTADAYVLATDSCTHTPLDSDGDGVNNVIDACPNTPAGATVDTTGCAVQASANITLGGIGFNPATSNRIDTHVLGLPTAGTFALTGYNGQSGGVTHSYVQKTVRGVPAVEMTLVEQTQTLITTMAKGVDGSIYVLAETDTDSAFPADNFQMALNAVPAMLFPSTLSVGQTWTDELDALINGGTTTVTWTVLDINVTSPGGHTGTILLLNAGGVGTNAWSDYAHFKPGLGFVDEYFDLNATTGGFRQAVGSVTLGGVTFELATSDQIDTHVLGLPTSGTFNQSTYNGSTATGPHNYSFTKKTVRGIPSVSQVQIENTFTDTFDLAKAADGNIYILAASETVSTDPTQNVQMGLNANPVLYFPSALSVGQTWPSSIDNILYGDTASVTVVDLNATSPGGHVGTTLLRLDGNVGLAGEFHWYWHFKPGLGVVDEYDALNAANGGLRHTAGIVWTAAAQTAAPGHLQAVAWNGSRYVVAGDNPPASLGSPAFLTSTDGSNWSALSSGLLNVPLNDVIWNGTQYLALVDSGGSLISTDGLTWTKHTSGGSLMFDVAWGGNQYVSVGGGGMVQTSADGITWVTQTSGVSTDFEGLVWNGSQFVAVGDLGTILTSNDGANWVSRTSGISVFLFDVTWGNNQFVAVGDLGTILTSSDGVTWVSQTSGTSEILVDVAWGGYQYVAVGGLGAILTSFDGITWVSQLSGTSEDLHGITWNGSQYVAVGRNGTILTSQ